MSAERPANGRLRAVLASLRRSREKAGTRARHAGLHQPHPVQEKPGTGALLSRSVPLVWPSAILLCVRHPDEHDALLEPFEDYAVGYPSIFGPPRFGPRCSDCDALMYVAAARVVA